jgi:hypothetical protein
MQATTTQGGVEMETSNIIENTALCDEYMGKYPVIFYCQIIPVFL